jgi:hypothetical protein
MCATYKDYGVVGLWGCGVVVLWRKVEKADKGGKGEEMNEKIMMKD